MQQPRSTIIHSSDSLLSTHTVLRNTYMLLALTLMFSGAMAAISMLTQAPPLNPIVTLVGYIGLLFITSAFRNSGMGLVCIFAFTGFMGWTLGPILGLYATTLGNGSQIIMTSFVATGVIFLSLSAYVLTSKSDFSFLGGFLFVGMIVALLASIGALFFNIPGIQLAVSAIMVFIASGLILFDTSRIIHNGERNYIMATIALYLDVYILFVNLLQLLGSLSGNNRN